MPLRTLIEPVGIGLCAVVAAVAVGVLVARKRKADRTADPDTDYEIPADALNSYLLRQPEPIEGSLTLPPLLDTTAADGSIPAPAVVDGGTLPTVKSTRDSDE